MTYYGKYRGTVIDNVDPLHRGRLLCDVPSLQMTLNWALPCAPYGGPLTGFYALPEIGATVWVEFENGAPDFPVWTGVLWEPDEIPPTAEASADTALVKTWETPTASLVIDDTPETGGITLETHDPAVDLPVLMRFSSVGVVLSVGDLSFEMNPETGIVLTAGETVVTISAEGVDITTTTVDVEAVTSIVGETSVTGASTFEGAMEVTGDVAIEGAVEIEGDVAITGASELTGVVEVTGDLNVLGAVTVEGTVVALTAEVPELNVLLVDGLPYPPPI